MYECWLLECVNVYECECWLLVCECAILSRYVGESICECLCEHVTGRVCVLENVLVNVCERVSRSV